MTGLASIDVVLICCYVLGGRGRDMRQEKG